MGARLDGLKWRGNASRLRSESVISKMKRPSVAHGSSAMISCEALLPRVQ